MYSSAPFENGNQSLPCYYDFSVGYNLVRMGVSLCEYRARVGGFGQNVISDNFIVNFCCKLLSIMTRRMGKKGICIGVLLFCILKCSDISTSISSDTNAKEQYSYCVWSTVILTTFVCLYWLDILLIIAGIETNPGPVFDFSEASKNCLSFVHLNVQSLRPKIDLLNVELRDFDIIVLTETWLNEAVSDNEILIDNHGPPFRFCRSGLGGGVCIYIKNQISAKLRGDLYVQGTECVWVEINIAGKKVLVGGFYRPPNSDANMWDLIESSIDKAKNSSHDLLLALGDFNHNQEATASSRNKIQDICELLNLEQLIKDYTHYTESSRSILDLILCSNIDLVKSSGVGDCFHLTGVRYHCPVYVLLNFRNNTTNAYKRTIWYYDRGDYDLLRSHISNTDWNELIANNNIDTIVKTLTQTIYDSVQIAIPSKTVTIRPNDAPWMHNKIRTLIRQRKRLYRKAKQNDNATDWLNFRKKRNEVVAEIRKAKNDYNEKMAEKINNAHAKPYEWWKLIKEIEGNTKVQGYPPIIQNDTVYAKNVDKAELFNHYFSEQATVDDSNVELPIEGNQETSIFLESLHILPSEVSDILRNLDPTKACGPDLIHSKVLRQTYQVLSEPLSLLFNKCLDQGVFPDEWKKANVIPVHKKDNKSTVSNYRPISLLNILGKVFEKCVHKHVYSFLVSNNKISSLQSGFTQNDSTVFQLTDIYNTFCSAIDCGKEVRVVFCDISKAFDRVWHKGLIYKLKRVGIRGTLLNWFNNYLSNRKQRVVINSEHSNWTDITAGVPQGSILGPMLFLVFINDIVENIHSTVRLFADDTSMYIIVDNPDTAAEVLNNDLEQIHEWSKMWLVKFNAAKTESMILSRKINKPIHPTLNMGGAQVQEVEMHKHLGVTLSKNCLWHDHISSITQKAWKRIDTLRSLKYKIDRLSLQKLYFSYIRPILEYADVIWDNCTKSDKLLLDKLQNEAMRIVSGATKSASISDLYKELGWESLAERRTKHKIIQFFKMIHNHTPVYLSKLIPLTSDETHNYVLRQSANLRIPFAHSELFKESFVPSSCSLWNTIPEYVKQNPSISNLKHYLNRNNNNSPCYYNTGNRFGQICHARLRLGCSSLNNDLYNNFISLTNKCLCGEREDAKHYLLECPRFTIERNRFILTLPYHIDVHTLLYGNRLLDNEANCHIFKCVQEFILKSKRFSSSV